MIAYNEAWLQNLVIRQEAESAYKDNCIDKEELENINSHYPMAFYMPHLFIRIGLFILTIVILFFSFGILTLLFLSSIEKAIGGLAVFFGLLVYAMLEFMIRSKMHYRSGVDDALLWLSGAALFGGMSYMINAGGLVNCLLLFFIALYAVIRFTDSIMAVVAVLALLGMFFFAFVETGHFAKAIVPFVLMLVSGLLYFLADKCKKKKSMLLYKSCLLVIAITSLITFYVSGNYYVVRELSNELFNLHLRTGDTIPCGWLFWAFTFCIPVLYLVKGIQKKDSILIWVGLLLMAAIVFTTRYYYSFAPMEIVMTVGGVIMVSVAYWLVKYLKTPKHGFTYEENALDAAGNKLNIEAILLAQTFAQQQSIQEGPTFGGGSFGGGGASGDF